MPLVYLLKATLDINYMSVLDDKYVCKYVCNSICLHNDLLRVL